MSPSTADRLESRPWPSLGNGHRCVVIGAIAIGTAILLLVSDVYGVVEWLPMGAMHFVSTYLRQPAPIDALIALFTVSLSIVGIWRNLPVLGDDSTPEESGSRSRIRS